MQSSSYQTAHELRHKTLSAYYPHLHTLFDYLAVSIGRKSSLLKDDSTDYVAVLQTTVCAIQDDSMPANFPIGGIVHDSQQEAIDRVLEELGRLSRKPGEGRNVLLAGDKVCLIVCVLTQAGVTRHIELFVRPTDQYGPTRCREPTCE